MSLSYDTEYTNTFRSPGIEPWVTCFLKDKQFSNAPDLGCSLGFTALLLKLYLNNVDYLVGLNISPAKSVKTKSIGLYDDLVIPDARYLPFRKHSFDLIISTEVLHGLSSSVLHLIEESVKDCGRIVLSLPSLPRGVKVGDFIAKGYSVYKYLLRGLILVELDSYKVLPTYNTVLFKIVKATLIILRLILKLVKFSRRDTS